MKATDYAIVIVPLSDEDGGGYAGFAPDLAGCMSDGATYEEALANTQDAVLCWLEANTALGRDAPEPGRAAMRIKKREQAVRKALEAALEYMEHADGKIVDLERRVKTLLALMEDDAARRLSVESIAASAGGGLSSKILRH